MTTYVVSHYYPNPKLNTRRVFSNLKKAQKEFLAMTDDSEPTGTSHLEVEGEAGSWKHRKWTNKKATSTSGRFSRK